MNRWYENPTQDPLQRYRDQLTPEYWADLFCRPRGDLSRLRGSKEFDEYYASSAFAWWLQVREGIATTFRLLDVGGTGEPDAEFTSVSGIFHVEIFGLHFPEEKLGREAAVHRLDRHIRERLRECTFPITTQYASHNDIPMDGRLRLLGRELGDELSRQLATSDTAEIQRPVRVKATRSQLAMIGVSTTEPVSHRKAREAFTQQITHHLTESIRKLRKYVVVRNRVLIVTDDTHASAEVPAAFSDIDTAFYSECAGVYWFDCSRRPFTLKPLFESASVSSPGSSR